MKIYLGIVKELTIDFPFDISSIIHPDGSFQDGEEEASCISLMKSYDTLAIIHMFELSCRK